jgi:AcrR family transcriptional regulator
MVAIVCHSGNADKLEVILAAARKRLGRYGFEKTTMSEIAADLNLSKASLYYYFPDKESLWSAVLAREQEEFFSLVKSRMQVIKDPEKMIREYVILRHQYFTTFLNLAKFRFSSFYQIRPHFREMIDNLRNREAEQFTEILRKGKKSGVFSIRNAEETALLFLEIIHGLRMIVINNRPMMDLTQEDYDLMFKKHRGFLELFIRSIKK